MSTTPQRRLRFDSQPLPAHTDGDADRRLIERLAHRRRDGVQLLLLGFGVSAWIYSLTKITPFNIGQGGLLLAANHWFAAGIAVVVAAFLLELARPEPRTWMMWINAACLIALIHSAVPIIFGAPEYGWVYKHLEVISGFQHYGRVSDPTNIYQEWPTLFAGVAWICSLAHVNALSIAAWAPLTFELANAVLLVAIFRLLAGERRVVWLALLLYEGLVAWVGQDYLSPQAFAYLLWLGIVLIALRWLRRVPSDSRARTVIGRLRLRLLGDVPPGPHTTRAMRVLPLVLVIVICLAIVTAHQLTPYIALSSVAGLVFLGLIRPRWLPALVAVFAGGFLALHYHLISTEYGGLFGGDPITNATGASGTPDPSGYQRWSARFVLAMMGVTWLTTFGIVVAHRRRLGSIAIQGTLAFAPFLVVFAGSYGGEAVYRVYLFSAPWCAFLVALVLMRIKIIRLRWLTVAVLTTGALAVSLQGLYDPVLALAFTGSELTASEWLNNHVPENSKIVLPDDDFPLLQTRGYKDYAYQIMPGDPLPGQNSLNEPQVLSWLDNAGVQSGYVVISTSMLYWARLYGTPRGISTIVRDLESGWLDARPVYKNDTTTIYHFSVLQRDRNTRKSGLRRKAR